MDRWNWDLWEMMMRLWRHCPAGRGECLSVVTRPTVADWDYTWQTDVPTCYLWPLDWRVCSHCRWSFCLVGAWPPGCWEPHAIIVLHSQLEVISPSTLVLIAICQLSVNVSICHSYLLIVSWQQTIDLPLGLCALLTTPQSTSLGMCPFPTPCTCPSHQRAFRLRIAGMLGMLVREGTDSLVILSWMWRRWPHENDSVSDVDKSSKLHRHTVTCSRCMLCRPLSWSGLWVSCSSMPTWFASQRWLLTFLSMN